MLASTLLYTKEEEHCQRHILRDRRPGTTACPGCRAMWTNKAKLCTARKKIFCTGPTRAAKAGQKYLLPAQQAHTVIHFRLSWCLI